MIKFFMIMDKARLYYARLLQFFSIPKYYYRVINFKEFRKSKASIMLDLYELFFSYKTFPDHYGPCRLWEVDKTEWKYYYGSNYNPHQRHKINTKLQNPAYRIVLDDKFLCTYFFKGLGIKVPYTFGMIDMNINYKNLLKHWLSTGQIKKIIMKPLTGRAGRGIFIAEKINNIIIVKSDKCETALDNFLIDSPYIVQEYINQHPALALLNPNTVNTIRMVTLLDKNYDVIIVNATIRIGRDNSIVDNPSAGGISVGIDCETGRLMRYAWDKKWFRYEKHPNSGIIFNNYLVPEWDKVCAMANTVQKAFSAYKLIGLDIAIDDKGESVLIEVNGAPDLLGLEQRSGPILKNKKVLKAFGEYGLLINRHQKKIYEELLRQELLKKTI